MSAAPSGDPCHVDYTSHGTFSTVAWPENGNCLRFIDDDGVSWEITFPKEAWTHGLTGTISAQILDKDSATCFTAIGDPLRVCSFRPDVIREIVGILRSLSSLKPGCAGWYIIVDPRPKLRVVNCADFDTELCDEDNEGRRVEVKAFVDHRATSCGALDATVFEFRLLE